MSNFIRKYGFAGAALLAAGASHAALPDSAAIVAAIGTDAASAAGVGASVLAIVMPLSIGFALLVKFIKKGTRG